MEIIIKLNKNLILIHITHIYIILFSGYYGVNLLFHNINSGILIISISIIELLSFLIIIFRFKDDFKSIIKIRIISDNTLIITTLLFDNIYPDTSFILFSIICLFMIESFFNQIFLESDKTIKNFISICYLIISVLSFKILCTNLALLTLMFIIIIIGITYILNSYIKCHQLKIEINEIESQINEVVLPFLDYEIKNTVMYLYDTFHKEEKKLKKIAKELKSPINLSKENDIKATLNLSLKKFKNIIITAFSKEKIETKIKLWDIVNRTANVYREKCEIEIKISYDIYVRANCQIIILVLSVMLSNSIEAHSKKIKIFYRNKSLYIKDNGCGMDRSKIKLYYTTKEKGNGIGLTTAIESLKKNNISTDIISIINKGTIIKLDFSRILL